MTILQVAEAKEDEVFGDIVRINHKYRVDRRGELIPAGTIFKISVGDKSALAIARGLPANDGAVIRMDWNTRKALRVDKDANVDVSLQRVGFLSEWRWGWTASDPAYRTASRVGVLSVALGGVGFLLGLISLFLGIISLKP